MRSSWLTAVSSQSRRRNENLDRRGLGARFVQNSPWPEGALDDRLNLSLDRNAFIKPFSHKQEGSITTTQIDPWIGSPRSGIANDRCLTLGVDGVEPPSHAVTVGLDLNQRIDEHGAIRTLHLLNEVL